MEHDENPDAEPEAAGAAPDPAAILRSHNFVVILVIATVLTASAGAAVGPPIIVGVVVAYLVSLGLEGRLGAKGIAFTAPAPS